MGTDAVAQHHHHQHHLYSVWVGSNCFNFPITIASIRIFFDGCFFAANCTSNFLARVNIVSVDPAEGEENPSFSTYVPALDTYSWNFGWSDQGFFGVHPKMSSNGTTAAFNSAASVFRFFEFSATPRTCFPLCFSADRAVASAVVWRRARSSSTRDRSTSTSLDEAVDLFFSVFFALLLEWQHLLLRF